ncbi:MAG: hypothetical protein M0T70_17985 [Geobacteraceae bacterium]|nr:hypothetical protein [Geobacteraceae bacterium]
MYTSKILPNIFLCIVASAILLAACATSAIARPRPGADLLLDTYHRIQMRLETNSPGLPLFVESVEHNDKVHVDVYGIFDYHFSSVVNVLKIPENWCAIVSLHPNVKACTYQELTGTTHLNMYLGSKGYQAPEDARQVTSSFRIVEQQPAYLDIILDAKEGPFGTRDHRMKFEALPLAGGKTFVHVSYTYHDSAALRLASKIYFATLGRNKVGFTVTATDSDGNPVYIGGPRGAVERSAVRYYLAIQSFMNTLHHPAARRFSVRISEWHDLTTRYRRQLGDMDKQDYLTVKTREHTNQEMLQRLIGSGPQ